MASRFSCSICLEDFTKPKLIDCHHTFCEKCLSDHIRNFSLNNRFPCPMCRRDIQVPEGGVSAFSSNFYLEDTLKEPSASPNVIDKKIDGLDILKCDVCFGRQAIGDHELTPSARFKCKECQQFMCGDCKTTHDSFSGCFNHVVLSLEDLELFEESPGDSLKREEKIFCPKHPKDLLEFFCRDCWISVCYKCSATVHNGHKIQEIDEGVKADAIKEVEDLKYQITYTKGNIEEYLNSLVFSISTLQISTHATCDKIDDHIAKMCQELKKKGEILKTDIVKTNSKNDATLNKLAKEFQSFKEELEFSLENATKVLKTDSAVRIVSVLPKLRQQVVDINETDYVVPEQQKVTFKPGCISAETINHNLLGRLEFRNISEFQTTFNLNDVERNEWGVSSQEFLIRNKVRCSLSINNKSNVCNATLSTNREPKSSNNYPYAMVAIPPCSFILELVNSHMNKTLMTRLDQPVGSENNMMHFLQWPKIIDWKTLRNPDAGFMDHQANVTFRVMPIYKDN